MNNSDDPDSICSQHTERMLVGKLPMTVVRQSIDTLKLGVFPPDGQLRVNAPLRASNEDVRQAVVERLEWIYAQQARYARPAADTADPDMVSGEQHWFLGRRYPLQVVEQAATAGSVTLLPCGANDSSANDAARLRLLVSPGSSRAERRELLEHWYQHQLTERLPPLLEHWQPIIGRQAASCGIKPMTTRWGSCNPRSRRIWLNLELVHKSPACLEYILVHELVHLLERRHGNRFDALMDGFMPDWQQHRDALNQPPLARPDWQY